MAFGGLVRRHEGYHADDAGLPAHSGAHQQGLAIPLKLHDLGEVSAQGLPHKGGRLRLILRPGPHTGAQARQTRLSSFAVEAASVVSARPHHSRHRSFFDNPQNRSDLFGASIG